MSSAEQILEAAENRMRAQGYNAVSYRDIAADVGIKSASLHYHFPKKSDLGIALVARYAANFQASLAAETANTDDPRAHIDIFIDLHRRALQDQQLICLCAVLGAEAPGLPKTVVQEVNAFFNANIKWLSAAYKAQDIPNPAERAKAGIAALEGALMMALTLDDASIFEAAAKRVGV